MNLNHGPSSSSPGLAAPQSAEQTAGPYAGRAAPDMTGANQPMKGGRGPSSSSPSWGGGFFVRPHRTWQPWLNIETLVLLTCGVVMFSTAVIALQAVLVVTLLILKFF